MGAELTTWAWVLGVVLYLALVFVLALLGAPAASRWLDRRLEKWLPSYLDRTGGRNR